ncbi:MAG: D-alanine--D-alanine ligase, partial [Chlamydiia bacterium]|nr:D-alanine--D-alanine ligase [Chlamydiia bacterium]
MKQTKIRVGVLFGGQSAEHEISIRSAKAVIEHLDPEKYEVYPIGIDKKGSWHHLDYRPLLLSLQRDYLPTFQKSDPHFPLIKRVASKKGSFFSPSLLRETLDVVFPILHGPLGEDGTVQGLLELSRIPYVGPDHLSSAICMDKGVMKALLHVAGLPTARYQLLKKGEPIDEKGLCALFPFPLFVKPAQMGSSLGITKVEHENELTEAIKRAFQYDETILIEEGIEGREIECSVLGNEEVEASLPGEV